MSGPGATLRGNFVLTENPGAADEQKWTLRFDFNAMCDFEEHTGKNSLEFIAQFDEGVQLSARDLRTLFWCALIQEHPTATEKDAGRLMSQNPAALVNGLSAAMPDPATVSGDAPGN